jgi:hypothetical protein
MTQQTPRPALAQPRSAPSGLNPFATGEISANAERSGGLVAVEQQRAIAEVQARMIIARASPRNAVQAVERILNDCTRPTLAERAVYQYSRGGTDIRGPSIRLAEAIAQRWGNIASGIKELSRNGEYSECAAYAWDLETGFYDERVFQIRHWRDTRQGGYQLTDERDIYELIANFGQRRKRAVLLAVIPGDVVEAALEQCERTMHASADITPEGIRKLVETFAQFGVTPAQIETLIQRRLDAIRPAQVVRLRQIYASLHDGMSEPADWFGEPAQETNEPGRAESPATDGASQAAPRRRGRPPGPSRQQEQPSDQGEKINVGEQAPVPTAGPAESVPADATSTESSPGRSDTAPPPAGPAQRRVTFDV